MIDILPIIMDLIVVFLFVLFLARGWHKGLARMGVSFFSLLIAIFLAWQLYGYVADLLRAMGVQDSLAASLGAGLNAPAQPGNAEAGAFIEGLSLPEVLKGSLLGNNNYEAYLALGVKSFAEYVSTFLASMVVNAIAILLVFVISFILLKLISRWLSIINKIPLIGKANQILGLLCGALIGYMVIHVGMFVLTMFATGQNFFSSMTVAIENSFVASWFYDSNLLISWIMKIFA